VDKIAIFGATGAIGAQIGAELRRQGRPYRVVARSAAGLERAFGSDPLAERMTWDPADPASVQAAATGVTTIVYTVGVPYWQFELHPMVMRATLAGAEAAGTGKIVLIGNVYPYGLPLAPAIDETHPRNPHTFKGRMRKEQEDLVLEADAAGRIHGTILRLPDFYGPNVEKSLIGDAFVAAAAGRRANVVGPLDGPRQYVFTPDAGRIAVAVADDPRTNGAAFNFAGSGTIGAREIIERIFAAAGSQPKLFVANKPILRGLGLFNPLLRELVEMNYLQTTPVILDDARLRGLLGDLRPTSYDDGIRISLAAARDLGRRAA
jgi:nucleoside-diphosphate-sugar epimerase